MLWRYYVEWRGIQTPCLEMGHSANGLDYSRSVAGGSLVPRSPTIMIPYPGPCLDPGVHDVAIYLRPESNGVKVESTMLKVIHGTADYRQALNIVYLANLPGDFIQANRVIEEHYRLKIRFARQGRKAFTQTMRRLFREAFGVPFEEAHVLGAFEALEELHMSEEELFDVWVPQEQVTHIHGQHVKCHRGCYIVNYDIPRLLHLYAKDTDIFSMILRSFLPYSEIHRLITEISLTLKREKILSNPALHSHVFHYSKGPFEQILDGIGYVYMKDQRHIPLSDLSFLNYLVREGCREEEILQAVREPILRFRGQAGELEEDNLFVRTYEHSFEQAHRVYTSRVNGP